MKNRPKKQHFIPKMHTKHFSNCDGKIFLYDKDKPEKKVQTVTPDSAFRKFQLYTTKTEDSLSDYSLEECLGKLENDVAPIFKNIITETVNNCVPLLAQSEFHCLDKYIYSLWKRTPEFFERSFKEDSIKELPNVIELLKERGYTGALLEKAEQGEEEAINLISHDLRAGISAFELDQERFPWMSSTSKESIRRLGEVGLQILKIGTKDEDFIIGSSPVFELSDPIESESAAILVPLSPDVAIMKGGLMDEFRMRAVKSEFVREMNSAIAKQSQIIAGRDKHTIESLVF